MLEIMQVRPATRCPDALPGVLVVASALVEWHLCFCDVSLFVCVLAAVLVRLHSRFCNEGIAAAEVEADTSAWEVSDVCSSRACTCARVRAHSFTSLALMAEVVHTPASLQV